MQQPPAQGLLTRRTRPWPPPAPPPVSPESWQGSRGSLTPQPGATERPQVRSKQAGTPEGVGHQGPVCPVVLFTGTSSRPGSYCRKISPQASRVGILTTCSTEGEPGARRSAKSQSSTPALAIEPHECDLGRGTRRPGHTISHRPVAAGAGGIPALPTWPLVGLAALASGLSTGTRPPGAHPSRRESGCGKEGKQGPSTSTAGSDPQECWRTHPAILPLPPRPPQRGELGWPGRGTVSAWTPS